MIYRVIFFGIPALLAILGIGLVTTFDFKTRASQQEGLGFGTYVSEIPTRVGSVFASDAVETSTLASLMPQPVPGWKARPTEDSDFAALTGIAPDAPTAEDQQAADIMKELENNVAFQIVQAQQMQGFEREKMTFTRGDRMMIVTASFRPARIYQQVGGAQQAMMQDMMNLVNEGPGTEPFATVQGIEFTIAPVEGTERARRLVGHMGRQLDIEILSTGNNPQNMDMLGQLDIAGFNALLEEPLAEVDPEAGVVQYTRAPPSATPAAQTAPAAPAAPAAPETPAVTRGVPAGQSANCKLENGVRRCTVGSN